MIEYYMILLFYPEFHFEVTAQVGLAKLLK
jgi:hypothetical protein